MNGGRWLGKAAVLWVLYEAPDVPAHLLATLLAVAAHAGPDGKGAYISVSTVAELTRKTESQARRDLHALEKLKLLHRGNQRLTAHIRPDRRPVVYDLPVPERGSTHAPPRGNGVAPVRQEEFLKNSGRRAPRARAEGADASAPETPSRRIWRCPGCGEGFTEEELADAEDRRCAEEGDLWHAECEEAYRASEECEP